jgi:hypothetical protein
MKELTTLALCTLLLTPATTAQADAAAKTMPLNMANGGMNKPGMTMDDMKKGHHFKTLKMKSSHVEGKPRSTATSSKP